MRDNILAGAEQNAGDGGYSEVPLSKYVPKCYKCRTVAAYDGLFDAQFCPQCNEWLEDTCDDPECSYCRYRPETPNGQSSNQ